MYHVKFCKSYDEASNLLASISNNSQSIEDTIPIQADLINMDNDSVIQSGGAPQIFQEPIEQSDNHSPSIPCWSTRISMPTEKANPENPPLLQTQKAVQESIAAGEKVRARREANRASDLDLGATNQGTKDHDQDPEVPNLANIASQKDIEHLLAAIHNDHSPLTPDVSNEP
ncbi:hypothetical protein C0992_011680 [Termitomyces sp. T32_za158]|nr:hypothetical protein C0992_011680 [Termitomyces sp. T32_za158]